ncbi:D-sedoheptulose-7-phosphate isomerase [Pseudonocardia endophytica]|uniref:D-sedoheptulose 7-phosphate isomerase n=1 Tax=Pseudonocardia endophytica TaxID=401976 RepID=A0A4R1HJ56_PSEEN|nr:SIS domain-containing protein [Pseudonocardia endophytica]TCK22317.1 D-sedoheptulose 7-phosphate isomerase [Pseudonocardia endophytica]
MTTDGLYPFLRAAPEPQADLDAAVARSTRDKIAEIGRLRAAVADREATALAACATAMADRFARRGRLYAFGNGGSSTDALAVASLYAAPGLGHRALPALSLPADVASLTALANDVSFDVVFARPLRAVGRPEDVAFGLSTSGGSENVRRGMDAAHERGMLTVAVAGSDGGALAEAHRQGRIAHLLVVPSQSVHRIQEAQTTVYQVLWELVQRALAP